MKKISTTLLLVSTILTGCKTWVTENYETTQIVRNSLDSPVKIDVFHDGRITDVLEIGIGEEVQREYTATSPLPANFNFCDSVRFTFDGGLTKVDVDNDFRDSISILYDANNIEENGAYLYTISESDLNEAQ